MAFKDKEQEEERKRKLDGLIFLTGAINEGTAAGICKEIIELNMRGDVPWIQMMINSCGGYCTDGFAIIDIMEWSRIPVYTTGIGMIASMGLIVFMAGEKGHRVLTPRTSILSHRYAGGVQGNHSQLVASRKEQDLMHQRIINHYLQCWKWRSSSSARAPILPYRSLAICKKGVILSSTISTNQDSGRYCTRLCHQYRPARGAI